MVADVRIYRWTGGSGSPTKTNITSGNTRLSASDEATPSSGNGVLTPGAGSNYTYWATSRLHAFTAPTGTISNLRWYTDGTNSMVSTLLTKCAQATSYVQASGTLSETGIVLNTTNHVGLTGAPVDVYTYDVVSTLAVTGSTSTTGDFGNFVVWQTEVQAGTSPVVSSQETFSWKYDET